MPVETRMARAILATLNKADACFIAGSPLLTTWQVCEPNFMEDDKELILFVWEQDGQDHLVKITQDDLENASVSKNVITFNPGDPDESFNLELFTLSPLEVEV